MKRETYVIISLRPARGGWKQTEIKSAGTFKTFADAEVEANRMNETKGRIYSNYMASKVWR